MPRSKRARVRRRRALRFVMWFFVFTTMLIMLSIGIFYRAYFDSISTIIKDHIWPAVGAVATLLGLVTLGVLERKFRSLDRVMDNGYIRIAVIETFLSAAFFVALLYGMQRPILTNLLLKHRHSGVLVASVQNVELEKSQDTIRLPGTFTFVRGTYHIKLDDRFSLPSQTFEVGFFSDNDTLRIDNTFSMALVAVESTPPGATVYLNGKKLDSKTPIDSLAILPGPLEIQIKMEGYKSVALKDTVHANGLLKHFTFAPPKLHKLIVYCAPCNQNKGVEIYGRHISKYRIELCLPAGHYPIKYIGMPEREPTSVTIKGNDQNVVNIQNANR